MIQQLLGPVVDFVRAGGFRAWSIGDWFFVKYANVAVVLLVAVVFLVGIWVNLPEHLEADVHVGPETRSESEIPE